jgi:sulfide:quinone oxidoreductase
MAERKQVLIAGGGVAGLEAALALRDLAGDRVDITMISPEASFSYRPMAVAEPFGRGHAREHALAALTNRIGITLLRDALVSVEPGAHVAVTREGDRLSYDALVVAVATRRSSAGC